MCIVLTSALTRLLDITDIKAGWNHNVMRRYITDIHCNQFIFGNWHIYGYVQYYQGFRLKRVWHTVNHKHHCTWKHPFSSLYPSSLLPKKWVGCSQVIFSQLYSVCAIYLYFVQGEHSWDGKQTAAGENLTVGPSSGVAGAQPKEHALHLLFGGKMSFYGGGGNVGKSAGACTVHQIKNDLLNTAVRSLAGWQPLYRKNVYGANICLNRCPPAPSLYSCSLTKMMY